MHSPQIHDDQLEVMVIDQPDAFASRRSRPIDRVRQWRRLRARHRWDWLIELWTPKGTQRLR